MPMPPPPPPMGGLKLDLAKPAAAGGGDARSALLQSIQMGAKLKKTVTVDKSAPAGAGQVALITSSNSSNVVGGPSRPPPPKQLSTDAPKLSGLFEGMKSMPKLKPVGARSGNSSPAQTSRSPTDSSPPSEASSTGDFSADLSRTLKLKRGLAAQAVQASTASPSPVQPTITAAKPVVSTPSPAVDASMVPNKSSLFGKSGSATSLETANNCANAPRHNFGKPNYAPKPPGLQQMIAASKVSVTRHHSMRSPKSPPIAPAAGANTFPDTPPFATMRGAPTQLFQSNDSINSTVMRTAPSAPISRPTVAPPRPPNIKPPPPPLRSLSNTNLTSLPLSVAPSSAGASTTFGSASNVFTLKEQFGTAVSVGNLSSTSTTTASNNNLTAAKDRSPSHEVAPPLPPHRNSPAPPPPVRQSSNQPTTTTTNSIAPPVPQRHSSMRTNSVPATTRTPRITVDLETKFGHMFHNVTEFPPPSPFTNLPKSYPSRNAKTAPGIA